MREGVWERRVRGAFYVLFEVGRERVRWGWGRMLCGFVIFC
jgi:hypothetical protein